MTIHYEVGDSIKGDRIIGIARTVSKPIIVTRTSTHRAQQITLDENAFCRIAKKMRFLK